MAPSEHFGHIQRSDPPPLHTIGAHVHTCWGQATARQLGMSKGSLSRLILPFGDDGQSVAEQRSQVKGPRGSLDDHRRTIYDTNGTAKVAAPQGRIHCSQGREFGALHKCASGADLCPHRCPRVCGRLRCLAPLPRPGMWCNPCRPSFAGASTTKSSVSPPVRSPGASPTQRSVSPPVRSPGASPTQRSSHTRPVHTLPVSSPTAAL